MLKQKRIDVYTLPSLLLMGFCSLHSATYPLFTITMTDTTYNGWTNRETWAIGLHLMDTVTPWITDDLEEWTKNDTKEAGQLFKDLVDEMIEESDLCDHYSLLLDLIDLSSVNWDELGQHALDAAFD